MLHLSGGDFTSFCYTSIADPVFGPPNIKQIPMVLKERGGRRPTPEKQIQPLLAFSSMWMRAIGELCRSAGIPLVLGGDMTFFEKGEASAIERECGLGTAMNKDQERQFAVHKKFARAYFDRRQQVAASIGVPIPGPDFGNSISDIDEFHYDREGTRALTDQFAGAMETLL